MDKKTYESWWQLHLHVVKGQSLTPDQQDEYDIGLSLLDEEEMKQVQSNSLIELQQMRLQVEQLQINHDRLKDMSRNLDKKIEGLEQAYQSITGFSLTVEPHASP